VRYSDLQLFNFTAMCLPDFAPCGRDQLGEGSMTIMSRRPVEGIA